jgi:hypothetical protein
MSQGRIFRRIPCRKKALKRSASFLGLALAKRLVHERGHVDLLAANNVFAQAR